MSEVEGPSERVKAAKAAIASRASLQGIPAKTVRDVLQACRRSRWYDREIRDIVGADADLTALRVQLEADGFLDNDGKLTEDGLTVAASKAQPRISRVKADKALAGLLDRVRWVNTESEFAFVVQRVILFGSYLTDAADLGDIDVMIEYARRFKRKDEQERLEERRRQVARDQGRNLSDFMTNLLWPQRELGLYLKAKDRTGLARHSDRLTTILAL